MAEPKGTSRGTPFTLVILFFVTLVIGVTHAAAGTLKVTSFPSGAEVIVDGVNTGKVTPMNISLADGDHVVIVRIPGSGWNPDTRTVTIVPGNNDLSVTLLPMLTAGAPGPKGDKGDRGETGLTGLNGTSITFVGYFSGSQNGCPNGGAIYAAGDPPVQTYVCNGSNGVDGTAARRADGPCFDNVKRYVDCGNGTVTDSVTGLIWLKNAGCLGDARWAAANQAAAALKSGDCGLLDDSSPGDWRLPTKAEWEATIARALALSCSVLFAGTPSLMNDTGGACYGSGTGSSFVGVELVDYWSSTTSEEDPGRAWDTHLVGVVFASFKNNPWRVWPVRSGSR